MKHLALSSVLLATLFFSSDLSAVCESWVEWTDLGGNTWKHQWCWEQADQSRGDTVMAKIDPPPDQVEYLTSVGDTAEFTFYYNYGQHLFQISFLNDTALNQSNMTAGNKNGWCIFLVQEENYIRSEGLGSSPHGWNLTIKWIVERYCTGGEDAPCKTMEGNNLIDNKIDLQETVKWLRISPYDMSQGLYYLFNATGQTTSEKQFLKEETKSKIKSVVHTTKGSMEIRSPFTTPYTISIRNAKGRILTKKDFQEQNVSISTISFSSGILFIEMTNNEETIVQSFIHQ